MKGLLLRIEGVSKTYVSSGKEQIDAIRDASFELASGELLAVMGPSGCGKSTLLGIAGLTRRPTAGTVYIGDTAAPESAGDRARLRNRYFGYIAQEYAAVDDLCVWRNIAIPLEYSVRRPSRAERRLRACKAAETVGIADLVDRRAGQLSGGQRQRVAIARAIVQDPQVVVADEPTSALDSHTASHIMDVLRMLADEGKGIIVATHDLQVARRCDRCLTLRDGIVTPGEDNLS